MECKKLVKESIEMIKKIKNEEYIKMIYGFVEEIYKIEIKKTEA